MSLLEAVDTLTETRIDQLCIDTIRTLSIDAVHTETVLEAAPVLLFTPL